MSWQSVLLSVALLGLAACTGDFEDINRNPNQVTEEQMDALPTEIVTPCEIGIREHRT